ncbi:dTDP-4-dehydrorhamnose 3,5-epimerase family protein [Porphyromonas sp.]|uniref:dTDP-4-dehydrorhamnose 3,5-epimerase family protein n=1 Tax=Porphyromonas sp. TaxID=1924944 RepID=UPI0026DBE6A8|nr:dTDP-4-dehydrorhamnose 3,5-epimerase family protein [Porphyromonas sp.]MDO4770808.1 dTDP-4-dehydrorhamnose 3,5-epimerase family protein [Porphyromonas sp.]
MKVTELSLPGVLLIESPVYADTRGCFYEAFSQRKWIEVMGDGVAGKPFLQENVSVSHRGVFRGMHLQRAPYAQSKLVRALAGKLVDIVLDIDPESEHYGKSLSVELSAHSGQSLYIPAGYAHGFVALEEGTVLGYKVDEYYHPESEVTYLYKAVADIITRYIPIEDLIISDKDLAGISL